MIEVKFGGLLQAAASTGGNVDAECTRDYASDFKTTRVIFNLN